MLPVLIVSADGNIDDYISSYKKEHDIQNAYVLDISPEKGFLVEHSLEVRNFVSESTSRHPYMIIMRKFDTAASNIQNSLLKTLEEDSSKVHFILVVSDQSRLLPTILSRVGHVVKTSQKKLHTDLLHQYACTLGNMTYPQWLSMTAKISKPDALAFLDECIVELEKMLRIPEKADAVSAAIHELIMVRKGLRDNNIYYEYALDATGHILDTRKIL